MINLINRHTNKGTRNLGLYLLILAALVAVGSMEQPECYNGKHNAARGGCVVQK